MRLWDYRLLKVLPDRFVVAQWRECIAIKRQWEKDTLKHRLVSYVMNYSKEYFYNYVSHITTEMIRRDIKYQTKYFNEISDFCDIDIYNVAFKDFKEYPEHNDRYLKQCYFNLQEKYDRGIVTEKEWSEIHAEFGDDINEI